MDNGRGRWLLWSAGIIMTFILTALTFMGTNVVANEQASRDRDSFLRTDLAMMERRTSDRFDSIKKEQFNNHLETMVALEKLKVQVEGK